MGEGYLDTVWKFSRGEGRVPKEKGRSLIILLLLSYNYILHFCLPRGQEAWQRDACRFRSVQRVGYELFRPSWSPFVPIRRSVLTFSSRRETPRSHVLDFRTTSCHNVLYMRSDISKEMSRFRLPSWGRRRLLLKVPNRELKNHDDRKWVTVYCPSAPSKFRRRGVVDDAKQSRITSSCNPQGSAGMNSLF